MQDGFGYKWSIDNHITCRYYKVYFFFKESWYVYVIAAEGQHFQAQGHSFSPYGPT